jgi:periplasmic divalent cation tolerance protein
VTAAVVVLSTAGSQDEAERIANALVGERLAACVNLVAPLTSIYRWHGAVERVTEVLLVIKTRKRLVAALVARLGELHSYDVPEAIVLPIVAGARSYLAWLMGETTPVRHRTQRPRMTASRVSPRARPRRRPKR